MRRTLYWHEVLGILVLALLIWMLVMASGCGIAMPPLTETDPFWKEFDRQQKAHQALTDADFARMLTDTEAWAKERQQSKAKEPVLDLAARDLEQQAERARLEAPRYGIAAEDLPLYLYPGDALPPGFLLERGKTTLDQWRFFFHVVRQDRLNVAHSPEGQTAFVYLSCSGLIVGRFTADGLFDGVVSAVE